MSRNEPASSAPPSPGSAWDRFQAALARPVNGASLGVFRIAVGFVMMLEAISLLRPSASTSDRVMLETYYTGPDVTFNFPYAWFEWLPFLHGKWMYAVVAVLGIAAAMMAIGLCYRISATLVFLTWGYLYAIESTRTYWMSYYYLELLITFLMIWMPAANRYSLGTRASKASKPATVPYWTLLLLRWQLVITYFYAGVAKLNADWLLDAVPVRDFLLKSPFLAKHGNAFLKGEAMAYFLSWSGAFFDLGIGFLLLCRKTRTVGMALLVCFHATNHFFLFNDIIWFPLLGVLTATIFLEPNWPERFLKPASASSLRKQKDGTVPVREASAGVPAGVTASLVVLWLLIQAIVPIRHYFIPGDGRFTWEGLSFSWRLKAEVYRSVPCEVFVEDSAIISRAGDGSFRIDWNGWRGERVVYRTLKPGEVDWSKLPEVVVIREPELGERIIFNPAADGKMLTEMQATARVNELWNTVYGRPPQSIRRTVPVADLASGFAAAVQMKGGTLSSDVQKNLELFLQLYGANGSGKGLPLLRRLHPFALIKETPVAAPFLVIEDPLLFDESSAKLPLLNRSAWKADSFMPPGSPLHMGSGALLLHIPEPTAENRILYPPVCIMDSAEHPEKPPQISWDTLRDLSISKAMHISTNPFLLRRYARRVATLWEREYGRRPAVHASTAVSLNDRPPQQLVDDNADLASVQVSHFRHNPWIKDLELARIPQRK